MAPGRPVVCVQGLGWAGTAMAIAAASACDADGSPRFAVIGVDLPTDAGRSRVDDLNNSRPPIRVDDESLGESLRSARERGNLAATTDPAAYGLADTTVVNIGLSVSVDDAGLPHANLAGFEAAIRTLGQTMSAGSLIVVASTVPPGATELVGAPILHDALRDRGLPTDAVLLAHSYERVMPGPEYLDSVRQNWRVYAGLTPEAADRCEAFLHDVIDTERYPPTRLPTTLASETAKVVENTYRAVTIAMMDEWARFGEAVGVDIFEVVDAIRLRPSHTNMRTPGFGVGGQCLPQDPLLGEVAARQLLSRPDLDFPLASAAVAVNDSMPMAALGTVDRLLGGSLSGRRLLLCGVAYRGGAADTRNAPAERFVACGHARGALVDVVDPIVDHWPERRVDVPSSLPRAEDYDAVIFGVAHDEYRRLDVVAWLDGARPVILDAANVLSATTRDSLQVAGVRVASVGRGT